MILWNTRMRKIKSFFRKELFQDQCWSRYMSALNTVRNDEEYSDEDKEKMAKVIESHRKKLEDERYWLIEWIILRLCKFEEDYYGRS